MKPRGAYPAAIVVAALVSSAAAQPSFTGLGSLAFTPPTSTSHGVSGNGLVAVGNSGAPNAYRWTSGGGMTGLGTLPGLYHSDAYAASYDGSAIAGSYTFSSGESRAFRWTSGGGMVEITGFPTGTGVRGAVGISDDGAVIAGQYEDDIGYHHAYYHTTGGGVVPIPPVSAAYLETRCAGISRDGGFVIGSGVNSSGYFEAYRYAIGGSAPATLGELAGGGIQSYAQGANGTGDVVVGYSESASGLEAFRWTPGGGMVGLGDLSGGSFFSMANAVSSDGSVVVGDGSGAAGTRAMLWTAASGMIDLQDYLVSLGTTGLAGWTLYSATGISADGLTFTGYGANPLGGSEAWIVTVPQPGGGVMLAAAVIAIARRRRR